MNRKMGLVVLAVLLCLMLTGCSETVYIDAGNTSYEVTGVRVEDKYNGAAPAAGQQFLLIQAKGASADMDKMQEVFFGMDSERITVSDSTDTISCSSITYAAEGSGQTPDITAILLFEVPLTFAEQFTLTGEAFGSVSLTSSQSALDSLAGVFQGDS